MMPEEAREELCYLLESIADKLDCILKEIKTIDIKLWYGEDELPEDSAIILGELDEHVGDCMDKVAPLIDIFQ